jgi:RHS repeat-associated protein
MASNLRRVRRDFVVRVAAEPKRFTRIDDPELALEVAARREKNNLSAVRSGLPAVGSKLVNRYGLEFEVESHVHVPTANSVQRWREGSQSDADLFPSIIPQNLSDKLTSFIAAVDRCTTKALLVLDTMPHARRDAGIPDGHWVDTIGNGGANLLFIDAAQIHETHFAHEIGHLWVQYVDQAEDERVLEDVSDAGRLHQFSFVQSFVTDLRVNQVIAEKGFDVSVIIEDQAASIASLGRAIEAGYRPENPREGVFMALALAAQILEEQKTGSNTLAKLEDTLEKVTRLDPELARIATSFAEAVERHGYDGKDQIRASIDECLTLAFDYSGDGIDLERDLVIPPIPEPDFDKYPQWIEGASPQMKCEVGRIMAREDIPDGSRWSISQGPLKASLLTFEMPDGTIKGPWTLVHSQAFATRIDHILRINEMNRQNRERQMKHQPTNGMPNFPGQPRRFYMAGTARFLTRVREAEWLGGEHPYAYAMNNPVTYTDPSGNKPQRDYAGRPTLPPGHGYVSNCCEAKRHPFGLKWFYDQVRNGGPWDFKQQGKQYEVAGNYHYGFMAACMGIPLADALRAAGYAQWRAGTTLPGWGNPWGGPPYGDDPKDQRNIEEGYRNAQLWSGELDRKCSRGAMERCYEDYSNWRDREIDRITNEGGQLPAPNRWWER